MIYRGSGVLNFALGAIGMVGAYLWWELRRSTTAGRSAPRSASACSFSAAIGALTHLVIMRPLRQVSPIVRVIATLGVLITLQAIAVLRYQANAALRPERAADRRLAHPRDDRDLGRPRHPARDRGRLHARALVALPLHALRPRHEAVAENQRAAASLGWSPDTIAALNWALGCGLAGLAAILIVPIVTLQPTVLTNLVLAATAAALVASFRSFPIALAAGVAIGIAQTEIDRYVHRTPGGARHRGDARCRSS